MIGPLLVLVALVALWTAGLTAAAPGRELHATETTGVAPVEQHEGDGHATPATEAPTHHGAPEVMDADVPPAGHGAAGAHGATASHGAAAPHAPPSVMDEAIHAAEHVSFIDLILGGMGYRQFHKGEADPNPPTLKMIVMYQMPIFSLVAILILGVTAVAGSSKRDMVPGPLQNFVEAIVGGLSDFVEGILGLEGKRFVPYIGTLFLYIWISNLIGILPFFKAPTASINTTVALALCTFLYVQYIAIRGQGPLGYLFHLAGEPRDPVSWAMVPLMLPLHIIGEFAKPLSLSLRLFGNIFGEETLVAVFVGMGVAALAATHLPIGLPFQTPFYFLALLTSTIQALVFSLLTTIYISLVLPHGHHDEHHAHKHAGHGHGSATLEGGMS